ncbi:hypothetical protein [Lentzea sp. E54]|uniref:CIS tube protein n=1 Tax=Lentzea xerophila TaxID=3435883 RepID=UPI003DA3533C
MTTPSLPPGGGVAPATEPGGDYKSLATQWPAEILCVDGDNTGTVTFDFNPQTMQVSRRCESRSHGNSMMTGAKPAGATIRSFLKADPPTITLDNLIFIGPTTKRRVDQLLNWAGLGGSLGARVAAGRRATTAEQKYQGALKQGRTAYYQKLVNNQPLVTLSWGPEGTGISYDGFIEHVHATFTRFSAMGEPLQAKVSVTLKEQPSFYGTMATNPTSGGLPGRSSHLVLEGENLQRIALDRYGTPARWRDLADSNGIDDPLRVRPGRTVYAPNPDEFGKGR